MLIVLKNIISLRSGVLTLVLLFTETKAEDEQAAKEYIKK